MYHRARAMVQELEHADAAKDYTKAEEIARDILKLPMDPAESDALAGQLITPMLWMRKHHHLEAWLMEVEKELGATPDAAHLLWFQSLGWEYQNRLKLKGSTVELGKAKSPAWLRVKREGGKWSAGFSQDGKDWSDVALADWITEKPCLAGVAASLIPPKEDGVPKAFHEPVFEPASSVKGEWTFEKALLRKEGANPEADPNVSLEVRSEAFRMDNLVDAGWRLQRPVEGDFTLTTQVEYASKFWEGGLRVATGPGHFAPRIYLSLDRDGVVRCQVREQDSRGAMAALRLARLKPAVAWTQVNAAGKLSSLGLNDEALAFFERVLDHDFAAAFTGYHYTPIISGYFHAGKEDVLAKRFLDWEPTSLQIASDRLPLGAYLEMARRLSRAGKGQQALAVARRGMALSQSRAGYSYRRLALQVVDTLDALKRSKEIPDVILDALQLLPDSKGAVLTNVVPPPHWCKTSGEAGENGAWNENIGLIMDAVKHGCAGEVWRRLQAITAPGSTDNQDQADRVLAGVAAHDPKILPELSDFLEVLNHTVIGGDNYFYAGAGHMLEDWKGHERAAMETCMTAARIDGAKTVFGWDYDLPLAEIAVRCALKCGDIESAKKIIAVLNERFNADREKILEKTSWSAAGVRILQNAIDQKHPEIAVLFVGTMETIVNHAVQPWPREGQKRVAEIKASLAAKN